MGRGAGVVADVCGRFLGLAEQVGRDPYGLFAELRDRPGVYRDASTGFFLVSRHADIMQVLRDPEGFSSASALGPQVAEMMGAAATQLGPEQLGLLVAPTEMLCADGERHARLRRLTNAARTPWIADELVPRRTWRSGTAYTAAWEPPSPEPRHGSLSRNCSRPSRQCIWPNRWTSWHSVPT